MQGTLGWWRNITEHPPTWWVVFLSTSNRHTCSWMGVLNLLLLAQCLSARPKLMELGQSISFPWIFFLALAHPTAFIHPSSVSSTPILSKLNLRSSSRSKTSPPGLALRGSNRIAILDGSPTLQGNISQSVFQGSLCEKRILWLSKFEI